MNTRYKLLSHPRFLGVGFSATRVWQKWRFSAPQTHLWLIKVGFSASTFVVKIATFAKPETVMAHAEIASSKKYLIKNLTNVVYLGNFAK